MEAAEICVLLIIERETIVMTSLLNVMNLKTAPLMRFVILHQSILDLCKFVIHDFVP